MDTKCTFHSDALLLVTFRVTNQRLGQVSSKRTLISEIWNKCDLVLTIKYLRC